MDLPTWPAPKTYVVSHHEELAEILEQERRKHPARTRLQLSTIAFVKEGHRPVAHGRAKHNLLQSAQGWAMEVNLGTLLCPDESHPCRTTGTTGGGL